MSHTDESQEYPLGELLACLDLEALDADLYLGDPGKGQGQLFGGMVAAQSVIAAGRTVEPERRLHSLHAYFIRGGRHDVPIRFVVDRTRDGRTFTTRRVKAHQAGEAIFSLSASFCLEEAGIEHQEPMPDAAAPESLPDWEALRAKIPDPPRAWSSPLEIRTETPWSDRPTPAFQRNWMRVRGTLPEDPLIHTAMLVYATDRTLLATASRPHAIPWRERIGSSLDHAVWLHHPVRFDDWLYFASESPVAHGAHGMIFAAIWNRDGRRIGSVAQEGLIRRRR